MTKNMRNKLKKITAIGIITILLVSFALLTAVSASPDWYDTDFSYRKQITITHANTSGNTLTNYPAFINVTKESAMQSDFDDIRFIDSSGNLMAFELENYTDFFGLYWVNITSLPNTGQTIWLYYGNNTVTSATNPTAVWDSSTKMVQHLNNMNDSTSYDNDAINNNADYTASGKIDGAYDFDGSTSYINCGNDPSLNITDAITIEAWVKTTDTVINNVIGKYGDVDSEKAYRITTNLGGNTNKIGFRITDGVGIATNSYSTTDVTDNRWHYVVGVFNGTHTLIYVDGSEEDSDTHAPGSIVAPLTENLYIGTITKGGLNDPFNGAIDEVRIYNRALSAEEINQSYQLATNQSNFVVWGSPEDQNYIPPTPINLANTTGNFWVNHTWTAGSGYITDSYNVSVNGTWHNTTNTYYNNTPLLSHTWSNISVFAFNYSGDGSLSVSSISQNTQIPNNVPVITNTSGWSGDEGELVYIDFDYTDLDSDMCTFSTNATKGTFNISTGVFEWQTDMASQGIYHWWFKVEDGYGSEDTYVATITLGDLNNPVVTVWYNNYTFDNSTDFVVVYTDNRTVFFNVSANQSIVYWVWYVDGTLYQNSSSNNITKIWTEGGNKTISVYGVNVNGRTTTLTWNIEIEYTVHEYANLIYNQNLLLIEAEKMLAQMWIFLVLLLIDFSMILFFFANTRNRIYGNVAVGLLSVFLTFILAHRALLYPVEMPDLSLFLNGIALVMLIFTILVIIEIVKESMEKAVS